MDYIRQLNAFDNWLEFNELGAGPQLLWYKLMAIANKSGWQSELSIANTRLQAMTKSTEKTLINHRNQLIQAGLLQYKKRGRTKAGLYILADLTGNFPVKATVDNPTTGNITVKPTVNLTVDSTVKPTVDPSAYINKTKQNKTKEDNNDVGVYEFISQNWKKTPQGILQGAIRNWLKTWGNPMSLFAVQLAFENSVELPGLKNYVERIFSNWKLSGIDTLEKAIDENRKFKEQRLMKPQKHVYNQPPRKVETVPDWSKEQVKSDPNRKAEIDRMMSEFFTPEEEPQ